MFGDFFNSLQKKKEINPGIDQTPSWFDQISGQQAQPSQPTIRSTMQLPGAIEAPSRTAQYFQPNLPEAQGGNPNLPVGSVSTREMMRLPGEMQPGQVAQAGSGGGFDPASLAAGMGITSKKDPKTGQWSFRG